jgi:hypothetical protein
MGTIFTKFDADISENIKLKSILAEIKYNEFK